jgi:hypothetical protein
MTSRPSLLPKLAPKRGERPPAAYLYSLAATVGWLLGWPAMYSIFGSLTAPQTAVIHGLTVAGDILWGLSMIGLWAILSLLQDYSLTLSIFMNGLVLLIDILSLFG